MSHQGEGNAVLATSQFSHNLSVSLNNTNKAKNLKLTQVEHACSRRSAAKGLSQEWLSLEGLLARHSAGATEVAKTRWQIRPKDRRKAVQNSCLVGVTLAVAPSSSTKFVARILSGVEDFCKKFCGGIGSLHYLATIHKIFCKNLRHLRKFLRNSPLLSNSCLWKMG